MNRKFKKMLLGFADQYRFSLSANWLISFATLTSSITAFVSSAYWVEQAYQAQLAAEQFDPVQARVARITQSGQATVPGGGSSTTNPAVDTDLSGFLGRDLADIENIIIENDSKAISFRGDLPKTGIRAVATNVSLTKSGQTITANAYDYVNLKYVQYNKKTKAVTNVKFAPPPGLFNLNEAQNNWPTLAETDNQLSNFFPTRGIRSAVATILGKSPTDTFTKAEWFNAFDKTNITLDLSNRALSSIAEIFNPNLRWGLGIYDLLGTANFQPLEGSNVNLEIRYTGLSTLIVDDNILTHFPNPNYKNFPALKTIRASKNAIQAIGNFNTFSNNHYSTEYQSDTDLQATSSPAKSSENYYQYLMSLWAESSDVKDLQSVKGIKKWLTTTLPSVNYAGSSNSSVSKSGAKTITDYASFLDAVSADPFYFKTRDGDKYVNQKSPNTSNNNNNGMTATSDSVIPHDPNSNITTNANGTIVATHRASTNTDVTLDKGINFGGVKLDLSKDIYRLDFSNNQIERIPLSKNMFTNVDFSNNRLRYITPIAAKPLPWFYGLIYIIANFDSTAYNLLNPTKWTNYYNQENDNKPNGFDKGNDTRAFDSFRLGNATYTLPTFSFYGNQLLDFWPQQDTDSSWYTWPKITIPNSKRIGNTGATVNSNVNGYPISPWNRQIGGTTEFYPWFHKVWIGPNDGERLFATYLGVFDGNFIHNIVPSSISTRASGNNLYGIFFNQLNDNKILTYLQSYSKTINYNVTLAKNNSNEKFILPGFNTTELKQIGTTNSPTTSSSSGSDMNPERKAFADDILSTSSDAYKSYNSQVPYILTRTLPQNHSVTNSWGRQDGRTGTGQKINVQLINQNKEDVADANFKNIDWVSLYANANGLQNNLAFQELNGSYQPSASNGLPTTTPQGQTAITNNGYKFLTEVLGQLPYYNGRKNASQWTGATGNKSTGLDLTQFATITGENAVPLSPSYNLIISAPNQEWTYRYTINVLTDTSYVLNPKDANASDSARRYDVSSNVNFPHRFKFASTVTTTDLANNIDQWTSGTAYIQNYIRNDAKSLIIKRVDLINNEIVVGFNVNDPNNNKIAINDITLTGFATQQAFLINNDKQINSFDDQDNAPNEFAPKNREAAITWIKNHVGIRWIGLTKTDNSLTTNLSTTATSGSLSRQNIYKLNELSNPENYISSVFFNKNDGTLSFTLQVNANASNGGINLVENHTITTFKKFTYSIDTSTAAKNLSASEYTDEKLKTFVTLKTFQTIGGQEMNASSKVWPTDESELKQFLPPETQLTLTDINRNAEVGSVDFAVSLFEKNADGTNGDLIDVKTASFFGLSNFNSAFNWKQNNDRISGIAFITHSEYQNKPVAEFKKALVESVMNATKFNELILPLLDLTASAPTFDTNNNLSGASSLTEEQKKQLMIGFHGTTSLSAADVNTNVTTRDDANLVGINFLTIKGGYLHGKFYAGSEAGAPVNNLPSLLVALKPNTTQNQAINNTYKTSASPTTTTPSAQPNSGYTGGNNLFHDALSREWKDLLPSEWLAQLRTLKNRQASQLISQVNYQKYDTLTGFLNHVLTTSTSNTSYQTHVDINNFSGIEINNSTGEVKIAANTLVIHNVYNDMTKAERSLTPQPYAQEISFFLSNYFFRIDAKTKEQLPFADNEAVNRTFANESVLGIINQLDDLLTKAQKLYNNSITLSGADLLAAEDAINILKFKFINPIYYTNPDAERFFTTQFRTQDVASTYVNQMTKFTKLDISNPDYNGGSLNVTVTVENYIEGFDGTHFTLKNKTTTFQITNTLGVFLLPNWNNFSESNLKIRTDDPTLTSLDGEQSTGTVTNNQFQTWSVKDYYDQLMTKTNPNNADYITLNNSDPLFDLVTWRLVDNTGIEINNQNSKYQEAFQILKSQLNPFAPTFNVRKQDVYYSAKNEQIYLLNPFLHFNVVDANQRQIEILKNIFDPNKTTEELIDNFNNYQTVGLGNVILQGFKRQTIVIQPQDYNQDNYQLNLNGTLVAVNQLSGADILGWLKTNLNEPAAINTFLQSFLQVQGFSRPTNPLSLVLNPQFAQLLAVDTPVEQLTDYILINDGLGELTFLTNSIQLVNSYQTNLDDVNPHPVNLTTFLADPNQAEIKLTKLKLVNSQVLTESTEQITNDLVRQGFQANIRDVTKALENDDFSLAYRYLQLGQILVSDDNQQQLIIRQIHSDLVNNRIVIDYEIKNAFVNGRIQNLQNQLILTGFNSNSQLFLKIHLPWIMVLLVVLTMGIYYGIWRYRHATNSIKFMQKTTHQSRSRTTKLQNNKTKK
ncbi:hypothetical protein J2Z62_000001 [Mycoplasmoides fastidiosum]|uniref:Uncharacterized protein n=1 Tax=Mycoplasmoides fastidiosum TaxID=92758 RepID=A0ABU0LXX2_9BACT|nr:hypothetical protein [Mycoplasmoides fastidiosum]MDQ0513563.1 hypothetical protein [Mycoplasmoides fastidiosum]UUD38014.1 hypothetical protein NPA10_01305 [Mycoplasmoides fastidiosum]